MVHSKISSQGYIYICEEISQESSIFTTIILAYEVSYEISLPIPLNNIPNDEMSQENSTMDFLDNTVYDTNAFYILQDL